MKHRSWILIGLTACVGVAHAGDVPTRAHGIGMLSGAAGGALIAGPPGAILGFMLGTVVGDRVEVTRQAQERAGALERRLAAAESELHDARTQLARAASEAETQDDARFLQELAARLSADVLFRTGSDELESDAETRLAALADLLGPLAGVVIELHGFADPRGDAESNLELSQRRAERVKAVFLASGLPEERLHLIAHGEELSTAAAGDADAYSWERRVRVGLVPTEDPAAVARTDDEPF
jgi:outer membrane protein OmpA-like peptidoglycan-associated protein